MPLPSGAEDAAGMGPRHTVIKEVLFFAECKGEGTFLGFPWAFE
jgi:hypothetical protein